MIELLNVVVTTYNRPDKLAETLKNLKGCNVLVMDDCSTPPAEVPFGIQLIRADKNHGKKKYWQWINVALSRLEKMDGYYMFLPDDFIFNLEAIETSIDLLIELEHEFTGGIGINLLLDSRESNWNKIKRTAHSPDLFNCGFIDGAFICNFDFMQAIEFKINPISSKRWRWRNGLSSGVWEQATIRALRNGCRIFQLRKKLFTHDGDDSKMNHNVRKKQPIK